MSFGLLGLGQNMEQQAIDGKSHAAGLEQQRNQMNEQIKTAEHQRTMSSAGAGAGLGASIGMAGGPLGMAAGAAIGGGAGYLVSRIFG